MASHINGLGRRKASVARVHLSTGSGNITVNGKDYTEYFSVEHHRIKVTKPLEVTEVNTVDVKVNVYGGGVKGQAEAVSLGIARALVEYNEELKPTLKQADLLSRDARTVERKKPGLRKARKQEQFSKR